MVKNFDHVTIVVHDVDAAKRFFGLLGFKETQSVVISGKIMEDFTAASSSLFTGPRTLPWNWRSGTEQAIVALAPGRRAQLGLGARASAASVSDISRRMISPTGRRSLMPPAV